MGFTQREILAALKASGRNAWNLRQMTALREEGFLPPLRRETQPGTNRPRYVWDKKDIDQIVDVYDWWTYYEGDRVSLTLPSGSKDIPFCLIFCSAHTSPSSRDIFRG